MSDSKLPVTLSPELITVLYSGAEQRPWNLEPMPMEKCALQTGDYQLKAYPELICVERKGCINEWCSCIGKDRDRFTRELSRLRGFQQHVIIFEFPWQRIESGNWKSTLTVPQVLNTTLAWLSRGTPMNFCDSREHAERYAKTVLFLAARKLFEQSRELLGLIKHREKTSEVTQ